MCASAASWPTAITQCAGGPSFSPPDWLDFFPSRVPLPEAAALFGLSQPALRWHAARVPGLAERRLGRVFVDLERLAELVAARPLAKAP
jgi:hypothetical protein